MVINPKQRQIIDFIRQGMTNAEIASRLLISETAAKKRIREILETTEQPNRAALVNFAWENNILPIPEHLNPQSKSLINGV